MDGQDYGAQDENIPTVRPEIMTPEILENVPVESVFDLHSEN
jgi:hypothetical protein